MNDNSNGKKYPQTPEEEQAAAKELLGAMQKPEEQVAVEHPPIVLQITLDPLTGSINVTGPIDNKLWCYGLLELARDTIREYHEAKTKKPEKAPLIHLPFGGRGRG